MTNPTDHHAQLLGEIKGIVSQMQLTQQQHTAKLDGMDGRLRTQETTAAKHGAFAGTAMAIGVALIIEGVKTTFRIKTGGGGGA